MRKVFYLPEFKNDENESLKVDYESNYKTIAKFFLPDELYDDWSFKAYIIINGFCSEVHNTHYNESKNEVSILYFAHLDAGDSINAKITIRQTEGRNNGYSEHFDDYYADDLLVAQL